MQDTLRQLGSYEIDNIYAGLNSVSSGDVLSFDFVEETQDGHSPLITGSEMFWIVDTSGVFGDGNAEIECVDDTPKFDEPPVVHTITEIDGFGDERVAIKTGDILYAVGGRLTLYDYGG